MKFTKTKKQSQDNMRFAIVVGALVLSLFIAFVFAIKFIQHAATTSNNLGQCIAANNKRLCTGQFFGLTEQGAVELGKTYNVPVRTVARNGETIFRTADYSPSRINIQLKDGVVNGVDIY